MNRRALLAISAFTLVLAGSFLSVACITAEDEANAQFNCPPEVDWPVVSQVLERKCGTLDCHGDQSRPLRLFGRNGARLDDGDVVGDIDATSTPELRENRASACGIEPEQMSAVVAGDAAPESLTLIRKPLLLEAHKGGRVWLEDSPGALCLTSWIEGTVDTAQCEAELESRRDIPLSATIVDPQLPKPVRYRVAIVEDEPVIRRVIRAKLEHAGFLVEEFARGGDFVKRGGEGFDALCLDLGLGEGDLGGMGVIPHLRASSPDLPIIVVTGQSDIESVIEAMRAGAYDFVTKPIDRERLVLALHRAIEKGVLSRRVAELTRELDSTRLQRSLVGESAPMRALLATMRRVVDSDVAVCILGESGTGKELVARAIHAEGRRSKGLFVAINCASIPEHLQESELFGHEKGAFTGATQAHRGRFEQAEGGTLFLDELGDMSLVTQVKLLRALQEKCIRRVGGSSEIATNVRLVCATHRDLEASVRRGAFREDLYFRLMVYPIEMPPLRDRLDDVPALVAHFMKLFRVDVGRDITRIDPGALDALLAHPWPGNVRELQNVVHRAMLTCTSDRIDLKDLPPTMHRPVLPRIPEGRAVGANEAAAPAIAPPAQGSSRARLPTLQLRELERMAIELALEQTRGHISSAAKLLGLGRATLYRRLVEAGMKVDSAETPDPKE